MSGEIAVWPFNTRERVCRATPRTSAASVTLSPRGFKQFSLMPRPGWGGFFKQFSLMPRPGWEVLDLADETLNEVTLSVEVRIV